MCLWNEVEGSKTGQRRKSDFHPVHQGLGWPGWELCSKWCLLGYPATGCKSQALAPLSLSVTRCGHWEWYNLGLSVSLLLRQTLKEQTVGSCLYFLLLVGKSSFEGLHIYPSQPNLMTQWDRSDRIQLIICSYDFMSHDQMLRLHQSSGTCQKLFVNSA